MLCDLAVDRGGNLRSLGAGFDRDLEVAVEAGDRRERGAIGWRRPGGGSVRAQPIADAVEDDHLAIKVIEGAQAEVAVPQDVGDGDVAVVDAFEQGTDRRELNTSSSWPAADLSLPEKRCSPMTEAFIRAGCVVHGGAAFPAYSKVSSCRCAARSVLWL